MRTIQKLWFHGTTKTNFKKIQQEGVLWGIDETRERHTFLAKELKTLLKMVMDKSSIWNGDMHYFELILSVRYTPDNVNDNYNPSNWEMIVTSPIPINNVKLLRYL